MRCGPRGGGRVPGRGAGMVWVRGCARAFDAFFAFLSAARRRRRVAPRRPRTGGLSEGSGEGARPPNARASTRFDEDINVYECFMYFICERTHQETFMYI